MKSFSAITKEELCCGGIGNGDITAELAGMLLFGGSITGEMIKFTTENQDVLGRYLELCTEYGITPGVTGLSEDASRYIVTSEINPQVTALLEKFEVVSEKSGISRYGVPDFILKNEKSRQSFIRGAFLGGGTIIDPNKNYNLEIVSSYQGLSMDFCRLLMSAGFEFKTAMRKSRYVLYIKNSEIILDFLTYIGAYKAQMELINIKIEKEIRNDFNRSVNSETANLEKSINAAIRQIQAIEVIEEKIGLAELPEDLLMLARLRLEHKSESLGELGKLLDPPIGKSGVNHRFQRIIALAERLSEE